MSCAEVAVVEEGHRPGPAHTALPDALAAKNADKLEVGENTCLLCVRAFLSTLPFLCCCAARATRSVATSPLAPEAQGDAAPPLHPELPSIKTRMDASLAAFRALDLIPAQRVHALESELAVASALAASALQIAESAAQPLHGPTRGSDSAGSEGPTTALGSPPDHVLASGGDAAGGGGQHGLRDGGPLASPAGRGARPPDVFARLEGPRNAQLPRSHAPPDEEAAGAAASRPAAGAGACDGEPCGQWLSPAAPPLPSLRPCAAGTARNPKRPRSESVRSEAARSEPVATLAARAAALQLATSLQRLAPPPSTSPVLAREAFSPVEEIGRGSHGRIVHCRRVDGGDDVAIKVALDAGNSIAICTFLDERLTHECLLEHKAHANVLGFLGCLPPDAPGRAAPIVTPLAPLGTLANRIFQCRQTRYETRRFNFKARRLNRYEARHLLVGCVNGLAHLHALGIIHRDVKWVAVRRVMGAALRHRPPPWM